MLVPHDILFIGNAQTSWLWTCAVLTGRSAVQRRSIGWLLTGPRWAKYWMRRIYTLISLAPAPLFFMGLVYNIYGHFCHAHDHGNHSWEMTVMWAVMTMAHLSPWILWWQQRNFTRN